MELAYAFGLQLLRNQGRFCEQKVEIDPVPDYRYLIVAKELGLTILEKDEALCHEIRVEVQLVFEDMLHGLANRVPDVLDLLSEPHAFD